MSGSLNRTAIRNFSGGAAQRQLPASVADATGAVALRASSNVTQLGADRHKGAWIGLVLIGTLLGFCLAALWQAGTWALEASGTWWLVVFAWVGVVLCAALSASLALMGAAIAVPWLKYVRRVRERRG
ncbi:hypothetical protein [Pseudoclavibacter sp. AY1H1]|uniref:hypothetical protein n=1 Tax=Pseudoclavibacter sp. AY1H1 TaxID=2080584 RepID=UPI0011AFE3F3|nr:hypothetical protein [Pseudoclavibacter sp. AY1H1]